MKAFAAVFGPASMTLIFFILGLAAGTAADTNATGAAKAEETNSLEILRNYVQLQEQLHATQMAIEQTRKETQQAASKSAEELATRLQAIETALATQRARELDAMQGSNRVMLFMAGSFAVVGFVAMLLMGYFQWRTVQGLAEISSVLPAFRGLGPGPLRALPAGDSHLVSAGPVQKANAGLVGALEQIEKRIFDLERTSHPTFAQSNVEASDSATPSTQAGENGNGHSPIQTTAVEPDSKEAENKDEDTAEVKAIMRAGQTFLDQDKAASALSSFDRVLALHPQHTEALVKKGIALERMQKLDEAIACYDAAIAADQTLTVAYLHKGGVFNRMERFGEALQCYELALRTQEKHDL